MGSHFPHLICNFGSLWIWWWVYEWVNILLINIICHLDFWVGLYGIDICQYLILNLTLEWIYLVRSWFKNAYSFWSRHVVIIIDICHYDKYCITIHDMTSVIMIYHCLHVLWSCMIYIYGIIMIIWLIYNDMVIIILTLSYIYEEILSY